MEWTNVKDKIPDYLDLVLCVDKKSEIHLRSIDPPLTDKKWFKNKFTHWMPIPEAPTQ